MPMYEGSINNDNQGPKTIRQLGRICHQLRRSGYKSGTFKGQKAIRVDVEKQMFGKRFPCRTACTGHRLTGVSRPRLFPQPAAPAHLQLPLRTALSLEQAFY